MNPFIYNEYLFKFQVHIVKGIISTMVLIQARHPYSKTCSN